MPIPSCANPVETRLDNSVVEDCAALCEGVCLLRGEVVPVVTTAHSIEQRSASIQHIHTRNDLDWLVVSLEMNG